MRLELALGAYLSVANVDVDPVTVAYLKGGAYTVEGPMLLGAALAADAPGIAEVLSAYARPLGAAFQLLDDLADGDASPGASRAQAAELIAVSTAALADPRLDRAAADALGVLAELVGSL
jgi:geranylgeranyl diphosphate synthase type I